PGRGVASMRITQQAARWVATTHRAFDSGLTQFEPTRAWQNEKVTQVNGTLPDGQNVTFWGGEYYGERIVAAFLKDDGTYESRNLKTSELQELIVGLKRYIGSHDGPIADKCKTLVEYAMRARG